jgi:endonuclease/exonuclease/phosphatase family metal-dependent hydrolase
MTNYWKIRAAILAGAVGLSVHAAAPVTTLKVMSFNIQVNGSGSGGINQCVNAIQNSGADIVGIQEADGYSLKNIASQLNWHFVQTGASGQYGVVSRYPIIKRIGETTLTYGGVGATIELGADQRVHLFNTHLYYTPYGPYQLQQGMNVNQIINSENSVRMPGLNELLTLASPFIASAEPTFLVGDFNAPSHLDYAALNWPESVACYNAGLADSYRVLHTGNRTFPPPFAFDEPGITWTPGGLASEPNGVYDRIDFIYYSEGAPTSSTELDSRNSVNPWPSDHRAVLTTFTIAPPPQVAKASSPIPAHTLQTAPLRPVMTLVPGTGATSHNVYFGTASPGTFQGNQTASKFIPGLLAPNTIYYWRVDEVKATGTVTGDVWSFKTGNFSWAQPGKTNYARNESITVSFGNGPGNKKDWIGLYQKDSAYGPGGVPSIDWYYLNNSKTAPKRASTSGSITFANGLPSAGTYEVRFFANDGHFLLDAAQFTVSQ